MQSPFPSCHLWIDADSFAKDLRQWLLEWGGSRFLTVVLVSNRRIPLHRPEKNVRQVVVAPKTGAADAYLLAHTQARDIVITSDITLSQALLKQGVRVVNGLGNLVGENFLLNKQLLLHSHHIAVADQRPFLSRKHKTHLQYRKKRLADTLIALLATPTTNR